MQQSSSSSSFRSHSSPLNMERAGFQTTFTGHANAGPQIGVNSGSIINNFHTSAAVQRPSPSIVIPFRRDRDFIERPVLDEICQCASKSAARVGIVGLGGVGKTQLAIEYAYRRREADPGVWVLWVHASTAARFEESYRKIAQQVQISGWADPKADVLSLVHAWLSDESNGRWTMVVDNADSGEVIFGSHSTGPRIAPTPSAPFITAVSSDQSLSDCLSSAAHGSIVITSRSREVAEGLIEYADDIFDVGAMGRGDAIALLTKKLKRAQRDTDQDELLRLVQELDCIPLAITQAAAYINQPGSRVTVSQYLDRLAKGDLDRERLLQKDIRDPRRDGRASNSIIVTWHTSFEHIRQTRNSAARLLGLMSLFDHEGIPQSLLQEQYIPQNEEQLRQRATVGHDQNKYGFEEDIAVLIAYSLINIGTNEQLFNMHRLVQFSTKKWLELQGELAYWQGRYISILYAAFPTGDYVNWSTCQTLFPHVEAMISYTIAGDNYLRPRAATLYRGAWYALQNGRYGAAGRMAWASLQDCVRLPEPDEIQTLESVYILALVLRNQGKYEQAEQLSRRAVVGYEKELGENHLNTLTSVGNLALVLQSQGKYEQAEQLNRRALAGYEKELGENHPSTLISVSNLAIIFLTQGKYEQSEQLTRRALAGREKGLGENHPDTLMSVGNLASVLHYQRKYEQAEQLSRRALAGYEKELGENHPGTLTSVNNLALVLRNQGKYEQAEQLTRRALAGREKELGENHPSTLTSVSNLALVLQYQGKYEQAEQLSRRALAGREKELGESHPSTLTSVSNLASMLQNQGKYKQAEQLSRRALAGYEKELGENHHNTLTSVSNLALVLQYQGKYEQSEQLTRRALAGREKELGENHPDTLTAVGNLASALQYQGKYEQAEQLNRRALAGCEKELGENHPSTLISVSNLAIVLKDRGKYEQAEQLSRRALAGREKELGENHPDTLTSVSNLASVLWNQGKYRQAEQLSRRALAGYEKVLGDNHPYTLMSVSNLASMLQNQGKYEQAEQLNRRALVEREKELGENHPDTLTSMSNLASVLRCQGRYEQAEQLNRRVVK